MSDKSAPPVRAGLKQSQHIDPPETEDDEPALSAFLAALNGQQLAGYATSMLFHMTLLLVLALIALAPRVEQTAQELSLDPHEEVAEVDDEPLEPLETSLATSSVVLPDPPPPERMELPDMAAGFVDDPTADETMIFPLPDAMSGFPASQADTSLSIDESQNPFGLRPRGKSTGRGPGGPTPTTQSAVELALKWLADHQNRDGSWSWNYTLGDRCSGYANPGDKQSKMGATGLALLPFLGAGYTQQEGKYKETVRKGIRYLVGNMIVRDNTGRLFEANGANHEHMYCHGIAACALAEAFGMTNDYSLQAPAQLAVNYIVQAQHPENGGWLYTPRAGGDTSVVGWQVMALKSAILSHLDVPGKVKPLANKWLDSVQWGVPEDGYGIGAFYGYRNPNDRPNAGATTAIGILCRNYLGAQKGDPGLQKGVETISATGLSNGNMYYNYYAAQVMFQNDGPDGAMWKKWNKEMIDLFVNSQVKAGQDRGSWYFNGGGHGAKAGGRIYCTAMAAMTLEVYYRYLPVYQQKNVAKDDFPLE